MLRSHFSRVESADRDGAPAMAQPEDSPDPLSAEPCPALRCEGGRSDVGKSGAARCIVTGFLIGTLTLFLSVADGAAQNSAVGQGGAASGRQPWTTSLITGSPNPPPPYVIKRAFPNLKFEKPVEMIPHPASDRLLVMEINGKIFSYPNSQSVTEPDLFADLKQGIPGFHQCYGMVFHPGFETNRFIYLCYVLKPKLPDGSRVSRFTVSRTDPPRLELESEKVLITWLSGGHNGGSLHFGPEDGYLYISTGDAEDPAPPDRLNTGQDISDLLSSILRIDVDRADPGRAYRVPPDNPFVNTPGARPEIWAYGLRNPWKMSFDPATGYLWAGDVGWELWEMIFRIERGGNYGWSIVEGPQAVRPDVKQGPTPILPAVAVHSHAEARSITGGYAYHGSRLPELKGAYIYGDWMSGRIWGLRYDGQKMTWQRELAQTPLQIICFGLDRAGEFYVVGYDGTIHRLVPNSAGGANLAFPTRLSQTGLFSSTKDQVPASGVLAYGVKTGRWSDGAVAERIIGLPGKGKLGVFEKDDWTRGHAKGDWSFPKDAVLAKTLSLELQPGNPASRRKLETQVLHYDGTDWQAYSYRWNDAQTDADLAPDQGKDRVFEIADPSAPGGLRKQTWHFASRSECLLCHTSRAGGQLGFHAWQLDMEANGANQLNRLEQIGLFEKPPVRSVPGASALEQQARAWLHVNCAHCHQPGGGSTATIDLRVATPLNKTKAADIAPSLGSFGIDDARIIAPGDPWRSVLLYRIAKLGQGRMPHVGTRHVDVAGIRLVRDWIASIGPESQPVGTASLKDSEWSRLDISNLLSKPSSALRLSLSLDDPRQGIGGKLHDAIVSAAMTNANPAIRDLFERFIPEEFRVKKLGGNIQMVEILSKLGNAVSGRKVFFETAQCGTCHVVQGQGKEIGPDLSKIGAKSTRSVILESLLEPSRAIEPDYVAYNVETRDGESLTGFIRQRTGSEIILRDLTGNEVRVPSGNVLSATPQKLSLMPEGTLQNLTAQEAADLLEFLVSLK